MSVPVQITMFDETRTTLGQRLNEHHVPSVGDYISLRAGESRRVVARQFIYQTGVTHLALTLGSQELL